ncbi:MAG: radical SAM protein [Myxococcales bacterium]|nr:radical SAM protein [Myxococcales bacterium]
MKQPSLALAGLDRGQVLTGPATLHVDITNSCNTNCITCWDHSPLLTIGRSSGWKRRKLEVVLLEQLLDDVRGLGALKHVILSGMGEPFTHPDVYRMIEAVKSRDLQLTIITNLVAADAERVLELGVDQLLIGIHAASEGAYRAFHPSFQADEWARLHAALARFRAADRRFKHVQVVCETNAHELPEMVELAAEYRAFAVNFKLASLADGSEACRISDTKRARLTEELVPRARELARELQVTTNLDVFEEQLRAGGAATAAIADVGCFMGQVYSRVTVDGTVLYCCNTEVVVGHLAEARFSELWSGSAWNALRARLRRGEYFDGCHQCGKLNQNVALRARFAKEFGEARALAVTGRGAVS